jgi:acetyltransferase
MPRDLSPLLKPKSIAIIGASETGLYPAGILRNLLKNGYQGKLYPVNPRRETVQGLKSYPKITDIEDDVDLAVITIPRGFVIDILKQCAAKGVKAVIVISAGFSEADEYGKKLEKDLVEYANRSGIIICGPNTAGLANVHDNIPLVARYSPPPLPGNVALLSQSGALMMALLGVLADKNVGLSYSISTGNQANLDLSECLRTVVEEERTRCIAMFVEGLKDVHLFLEATDIAAEKGKPIVALKVGMTAAGAAAAATHTGSLTGSPAVYKAVFRQKGVIAVTDIEELIDTAKAFSTFIDKLPKGDGVGIISQTGGGASLSADIASELGLNLPPLSEQTARQLNDMDELLLFGGVRNPADVRGAGTRVPFLPKILDLFLEEQAINVIGVILARTAIGEEDVGTAKAILEVAKNASKPLFIIWIGKKIPDAGNPIDEQPYRILENGGVPVFSSVRMGMQVIKHLVDYTKFQTRHLVSRSGAA